MLPTVPAPNKGFPTYSATLPYGIGNIVCGSDSNEYRATASTTGHDPTTDAGTYWELYRLNANTTLSVGSAARFTTIAAAVAFAQNCFVGEEFKGTIQVADGTLTVTTATNLGLACGLRWQLIGNTTTPANCVITFTTNADIPVLAVTAPFGFVDGFTINGYSSSVSVAIQAGPSTHTGIGPPVAVTLGPHMVYNSARIGAEGVGGSQIYLDPASTFTDCGMDTSPALNTLQLDGTVISDGTTGPIPGTGITALTGDGTASGTGSVTLTLATVNSSPGTIGDAAHTGVPTINGKGLVTAWTNTAIAIAQSAVSGLASALSALTSAVAACLVASNNLSDLTSDSTARTNLGLGTAAVKDVPASGNASSGQVVLGNDSRLGGGGGGGTAYDTNNSSFAAGDSLTVTHASDPTPYKRAPSLIIATPDCAFLCNPTGVNGGTTFTDATGLATVTTENAAVISNAEEKFSQVSIYLPQTATTDYLNLGMPSAVEFGSRDFTVEAWIYALSANGSGANIIFGSRATSGDAQSWILALDTAKLYFLASSNNGGWDIPASGGFFESATLPLNQWCHVAACRQGSSWYLLRDGSVVASDTNSSAIADPVADSLIGADAGNANGFQGYMSNIRVTLGTALYTSSYTVPSAAFSVSFADQPVTLGNSVTDATAVSKALVTYASDTTTEFSLPGTWGGGSVNATGIVVV